MLFRSLAKYIDVFFLSSKHSTELMKLITRAHTHPYEYRNANSISMSTFERMYRQILHNVGLKFESG